jgi:hypothetical protein
MFVVVISIEGNPAPSVHSLVDAHKQLKVLGCSNMQAFTMLQDLRRRSMLPELTPGPVTTTLAFPHNPTKYMRLTAMNLGD